MENFATSVATMLVALAFVLLLAWGALHLLKRFQLGRGGAAAGAPQALRFVRALPVGARERVVVVHYRGEEWVLGVTAGGISLLAREPVPAPMPDEAQASK
ncbi:MAG TPA: flagellar biosynthetic protein FliO [Burkholderiaceae bacterium]